MAVQPLYFISFSDRLGAGEGSQRSLTLPSPLSETPGGTLVYYALKRRTMGLCVTSVLCITKNSNVEGVSYGDR